MLSFPAASYISLPLPNISQNIYFISYLPYFPATSDISLPLPNISQKIYLFQPLPIFLCLFPIYYSIFIFSRYFPDFHVTSQYFSKIFIFSSHLPYFPANCQYFSEYLFFPIIFHIPLPLHNIKRNIYLFQPLAIFPCHLPLFLKIFIFSRIFIFSNHFPYFPAATITEYFSFPATSHISLPLNNISQYIFFVLPFAIFHCYYLFQQFATYFPAASQYFSEYFFFQLFAIFPCHFPIFIRIFIFSSHCISLPFPNIAQNIYLFNPLPIFSCRFPSQNIYLFKPLPIFPCHFPILLRVFFSAICDISKPLTNISHIFFPCHLP